MADCGDKWWYLGLEGVGASGACVGGQQRTHHHQGLGTHKQVTGNQVIQNQVTDKQVTNSGHKRGSPRSHRGDT
jgi:hypothetical protein